MNRKWREESGGKVSSLLLWKEQSVPHWWVVEGKVNVLIAYIEKTLLLVLNGLERK